MAKSRKNNRRNSRRNSRRNNRKQHGSGYLSDQQYFNPEVSYGNAWGSDLSTAPTPEWIRPPQVGTYESPLLLGKSPMAGGKRRASRNRRSSRNRRASRNRRSSRRWI